VVQLDPRNERSGVDQGAQQPRRTAEEMQARLKRENAAARFSMEDICNEEMKLERDDGERPARGGRRQ